MKTILVTGGLGFIGSHFVVEIVDALLKNSVTLAEKNEDYKVLVLDDLSNTKVSVASRLVRILKEAHQDKADHELFAFEKVDINDLAQLEKIFEKMASTNAPISQIIHFAGRKHIVKSIKNPLDYFETNFIGTWNLLKCMEKYDCKNFIFSSTSMVYGNNKSCKETDPTVFLTPYAASKGCADYMMASVGASRPEWSLISLRYFNVCGAHESGLLGDCQKYPNHLFPYIEEVMTGKREMLSVFGNDYPTKDGTGVRDFIHVVDLAQAHIAALNKQIKLKGHHIYNIGTNTGYSVLDIIKTYSLAAEKEVPYKIVDRRLGDSDITLSCSDKAQKELEWEPKKTLFDMCKDSYRWRSNNPDGYE